MATKHFSNSLPQAEATTPVTPAPNQGVTLIPLETRVIALEQKIETQAATIADLAKRLEALERLATSQAPNGASQPTAAEPQQQTPAKSSRPKVVPRKKVPTNNNSDEDFS